MRNPWATEVYNGPWRDEDPQWTPELQAQAGAVHADDGIFFMPFDAFRKAFTQYSIAMYQEWKVDQKTIAASGESFTQYIKSEVNQAAAITLDYPSARSLPPTCEQPPVYYNLYIQEAATGEYVAQEPVSHTLGYGYYYFARGLRAGRVYKVMIYNWDDSAVSAGFTLSVYAS